MFLTHMRDVRNERERYAFDNCTSTYAFVATLPPYVWIAGMAPRLRIVVEITAVVGCLFQ